MRVVLTEILAFLVLSLCWLAETINGAAILETADIANQQATATGTNVGSGITKGLQQSGIAKRSSNMDSEIEMFATRRDKLHAAEIEADENGPEGMREGPYGLEHAKESKDEMLEHA